MSQKNAPRAALAFACLAAALGGCFPSPRPSDAGTESFARQVVPKLQGRKARSYDEVRLLKDVADFVGGDRGRGVVADALMREDDYVTHWEKVLSDQLRIARSGAQSLNGCYTDVTPEAASLTDTLARNVRDNVATSAVGGGASMTSLLRSSLRLDNLSPALRAHIFAFNSKPITGANIIEENRRADFVRNFNDSYLDRDLGCTGCHNSAWSISGEQTGWDRTWPVLGYFEKALFRSHSGTTPEAEGVIFRGDARGGVGATVPFGLKSSCGSYAASSSLPTASPDAVFGEASLADPRRTTVRDLEQSLRRGVNELQNGMTRLPSSCDSSCDGCPGASDGAPDLNARREDARAQLAARCSNGCHAGVTGAWKPALQAAHANTAGWDAALIRGVSGTHTYIVPQDPDASWIYQRVRDHEMPTSGGLSGANYTNFLNAWAAYINALPTSSGCSSCTPTVCDGINRDLDGDEAFAFLVAQKVSNTAFEHVFGRRLTIANHFARNSPQLGALWNLTEFTMIPGGEGGGWSLRAPLRKLVTSRLFNRLSPRHADGAEPYEVPNVLDPWTEGDPRAIPVRDPDEEYNAMTEGVHRHSAETLLRSAGRALGWPEKARFSSGSSYPNDELRQATGAYLENARPGFNTVDFQGLLHWESVHGACNKSAAGVSGTDFVNELMGYVAAYASAHGGAQPSYRDAVLALKDRVLAHPYIDASFVDESGRTEQDVLEDYFGVASLNDPVSPGTLEQKLRGYCGVLVESPQFMLAGIEPTQGGEHPVLLPNTYRNRCLELRPLLEITGYKMLCLENGIVFLPFPITVGDTLGKICPDGACRVIPWNEPICTKEPWSCVSEIPLCDPSSSDLGGCGTPLDEVPADFSGGLVAKLGGATITAAEKVTLYRQAKKFEPETAKPGTVLEPGDWLRLPGESFLALKDKNGKEELQTAKPVKPKTGKNDGKPYLIQVSGEPKQMPKNPLAELPVGKEYADMVMQHPSRAWGEGGALAPSDTVVDFDTKAALERLKKGESADWILKHPPQIQLNGDEVKKK